MVTPREERKVKDLSRKLKTDFEQVKIPQGKDVCERQLMNFMHRVNEVEVEEEEIAPFIEGINEELENLNREDLIKRFVSLEFNRFWEYYKNADDLNLKSTTQRRNKRESNNGEDRMFINIGKKDGIDVPRLLNLIHKQCGVRGKNVGRVDLKGVFSFFDVDKGFTDEIIKGFAGAVIGGRKIRIEVSGDRPTESSHRKGRSRGGDRDRGGRRDRGDRGYRKDSSKDRRGKGDGKRFFDRKKKEA